MIRTKRASKNGIKVASCGPAQLSVSFGDAGNGVGQARFRNDNGRRPIGVGRSQLERGM